MASAKSQPESLVHGYFYSMIEISIVRILVGAQAFEAIPLIGDISIDDVAMKTKAAKGVLERFFNFLVLAQVLSCPSPGRIAHTNTSRVFTDKRAAPFMTHLFDYFMLPAAHWPDYFDINGLAEPRRADRTPYGLATSFPDKHLYEVLETMPLKAIAFQQTMAVALEGMPTTGLYDFRWLAEQSTNVEHGSRAMIVDLGGGKGQALRDILRENPCIVAERCVLQDLPNVIGMVETDPMDVPQGVVKVAKSMFDEVPTKGAFLYHIRRVLNDWPDDACAKILQKVRDACAADSRVLISEQLLDQSSLNNAAGDIWMMNFGGKRRSENMFAKLAAITGFRLAGVYKDHDSPSAVLELVPV